MMLRSILAIEAVWKGYTVSLSRWFELGDSGLRSGSMVQCVKMRDCGASEGELNDWDGKGRKEVGSRGWTRCLALIYMYRHRLRIAFAQQLREAHMFSAYGTRKTAVLLTMTDSQIHMISDITTEQFEQVQCHNLNGQ